MADHDPRYVGINIVQRCVVATCQKTSSSTGTISASTVGLRRRQSLMRI